MDAVASARIPVEIKRQGDAKLKEIGANTTALINAAYDYLLKTGSLPNAQDAMPKPKKRKLTASQKADFAAFVDRTTVAAPHSWEGKSYEELYDEAMAQRYAEYL